MCFAVVKRKGKESIDARDTEGRRNDVYWRVVDMRWPGNKPRHNSPLQQTQASPERRLRHSYAQRRPSRTHMSRQQCQTATTTATQPHIRERSRTAPTNNAPPVLTPHAQPHLPPHFRSVASRFTPPRSATGSERKKKKRETGRSRQTRACPSLAAGGRVKPRALVKKRRERKDKRRGKKEKAESRACASSPRCHKFLPRNPEGLERMRSPTGAGWASHTSGSSA